ncbi:MAG TPA: hypothetical protein DEA73_05310 [Peptococcaceae bacterium]|nr:hypothetical protein [Peptococcaceae bacterium]
MHHFYIPRRNSFAGRENSPGTYCPDEGYRKAAAGGNFPRRAAIYCLGGCRRKAPVAFGLQVCERVQ